jgi:hypothetical protein
MENAVADSADTQAIVDQVTTRFVLDFGVVDGATTHYRTSDSNRFLGEPEKEKSQP